MKKTILIMMIISIIVTTLGVFMACEEKTNVDVGNISMKLNKVTEDGLEEISLDSKLSITEQYKLELTCDLIAQKTLDAILPIQLKIKLPPVKIAKAEIDETNTGEKQTIPFNDSITGEQGMEGVVTFSLPTVKKEPKEIKVVIEIEPIVAGKALIQFKFVNNNNDIMLTGSGRDGYTKYLNISTDKLESPTLTVFDNEKIKWNHVENADYYKIYVDDEVLVDSAGEEIIVKAEEGTTAGAEIIFQDLSKYILGAHSVSVRAFSDQASIFSSNKSDAVEINI